MEHPVDVRELAARRLWEIERTRALATDLWEGPRRGAETALVLGVLRRRGTLDAVLAAYSSRRLAVVRPETRAALRTGLFELLFHDDAPQHAVVHAACESVKALGRPRDVGFVNAVLRQVMRSSGRVPADEATDPRRSLPRGPVAVLFRRSVFPDRNHDPAGFLAARASTAPWIAARRLAELGFDRALDCLERQASVPATHLRPAPGAREEVRRALADAGLPVEDGPHEELLTLPPQVKLGEVFALVGDRVVVQDAVASRVAPFSGARPGMRALDYCAAPGGKATHLAQLVGAGGRVRAWDTDEPRLARVAENAERLGLAQLECGRPDGEYDVVLVDAPCSNTGVLARRPEARWRVKERHLRGLAQRQLRILKDASAHVAPGGTLVYSTCSLEPEENAGVVASLLDRGGFALGEARTLYPDEAAGDGGFMARLTRT